MARNRYEYGPILYMIKIGKLYVAVNPDDDENEEARKIQLTEF